MKPITTPLFRWRNRVPLFFLPIGFLLLIGFASSQNANPAKPQSVTPQQQSAQPVSTLPPLRLDGNAALHHLNQVISWYRHSTTGVRDVGLPSDAIYQDNAKALGAEVVQLAFQSAKVESAIITTEQKAGANQAGTTSQQQTLDQMKAKTSSQIDQFQSQIDVLNKEIPRTRPSKRESLIAQRDALQGAIRLQKAKL